MFQNAFAEEAEEVDGAEDGGGKTGGGHGGVKDGEKMARERHADKSTCAADCYSEQDQRFQPVC